MTYEEFFQECSRLLNPLQTSSDPGEEFRAPPLDVLRYEVRPVRLHWIPVLGRALGVVSIIHQPKDITASAESHRALLLRVSQAVHGRYPPWPSGGHGFVIGLTTVIVTTDRITPQDEQFLEGVFPTHFRSRIVPMAIFRVNLEQEAFAFAIGPSAQDLFPEPMTLADGLSSLLGRFVPPLELD
ncbi:hypothetical protein [Tautonia rosea]|uniref:hypothetical protein n=1 Tax=Tautonia rosea TaxID=2728037 RepID=UPI001475FEEF|nr:hypothetical protein [Tautonia rosea]